MSSFTSIKRRWLAHDAHLCCVNPSLADFESRTERKSGHGADADFHDEMLIALQKMNVAFWNNINNSCFRKNPFSFEESVWNIHKASHFVDTILAVKTKRPFIPRTPFNVTT